MHLNSISKALFINIIMNIQTDIYHILIYKSRQKYIILLQMFFVSLPVNLFKYILLIIIIIKLIYIIINSIKIFN